MLFLKKNVLWFAWYSFVECMSILYNDDVNIVNEYYFYTHRTTEKVKSNFYKNITNYSWNAIFLNTYNTLPNITRK